MASAFNLTAQINLQGPKNLKTVVSNIKKQLSGIKANVDININSSSTKNLAGITAKLQTLSKVSKQANLDILQLNQSLGQLASGFSKLSSSSANSINGINTATKSLATTKKRISESRTELEEFGKQAGLAVRRFAAYTTVTTAVFALTNALSGAFKEFVNFNREIVRLSQVTGESVSNLSGVTKEIFRLSTSLGVASSDLLKVATTLAQAGLSASETQVALEALAKSALAPSFDNLNDTVEGSIAVLRQFGLQASDLESALGSINAVSAAFAVEAGDLIKAIQRTGGVFAASSRGVSQGKDALNEFLAVFTSVRATTRESAETIATGLRTIFTRIQRESTVEALKDLGIELRNAEGQFVGTFEAVKRLSDGLNRIDPRSREFSQISEELGGFRQIGKVIPLIQEFATAQQALQVAQRGSGSLAKDAITAQQALAIQFTKTREKFLELVNTLASSQSFQGIAKVAFFLADSLIQVTKSIEPLLPLLTILATFKIGSALPQLASGFGGGLFGGGGAVGGGGGIPPQGGGGGGTGAGSGQQLTSTLSNVNTTLLTLNNNIVALNQNIVNNNSLLSSRPSPRGFATGGLVPGRGNRDTVGAMLTPGEFVIRKKAVEAIGAQNLARMNSGGIVQKFARAGRVKKKPNLEIEILREIFGDELGPGGGVRYISNKTVGRGKDITTIPQANELRASKIKSKTAAELAQETGLQQSLIEKAKTRLEALAAQGIAQKQLTLEQKQQALDSGNVLEFGLVGLRYGSGSGGKNVSTTDVLNFPKPPGFETTTDNIRATDTGQSVRIFSSAVSERSPELAQNIQELLLNNFKTAVESSGKLLAGKIGTGYSASQDLIDKAVKSSDFYNVIGSGLEAAIGTLGAPIIPKTERTKSIDFPGGLGSKTAGFFGIPSTIPTDVTRTIGGEGKGLGSSDYLGSIQRFLQTPEGKKYLATRLPIVKAASGGSISGQDTVPALLTPGEFVINKQAASRIGYNKLNKLNRADKIRGYNKGGVVGGVQKFAAGGSVDPTAAIIGITAAISILAPQIDKVASSFDKLSGEAAGFGTAISGAIQQASGLGLATAGGLRIAGASEKLISRATIGAGIGGAIGGSLTSVNTKNLEIALKENTSALSRFDKLVQETNQTTDSEQTIRLSKEINREYANLVATFDKNAKAIEQADRYKKLGESVTGAVNTFVLITTSLLALNSQIATQQASGAAGGAAAGAAGGAAAGAAAGAGGRLRDPRTGRFISRAAAAAAGAAPAAPAAAASSLAIFGTTLLRVGGFLVRFAGGIGLAIAAIQLVYGAYKFFTKATETVAKDYVRLSNALKEATNSTLEFNIANSRYVESTIKAFNELNKESLTPEQRTTALGGISALPRFDSVDLLTNGLRFSIRETNLLLRRDIVTALQNANFIVDPNQNFAEMQRGVPPESRQRFASIGANAVIEFLRKQFVAATVQENPDVNQSEAAATFEKLLKEGQLAAIDRVVAPFTAAANESQLAADTLTLATRSVSVAFVSLNEVINSFGRKTEAVTSDFEASLNLSQLRAQGLSGDSSPIVGRNIQDRVRVLSNIQGFSESRVTQAVVDTFSDLSNSSSKTTEEFNRIKKETTALVTAFQRAERDFPTILANFGGGGTLDNKGLNTAVENLLEGTGLSKSVVESISNAFATALVRSGDKVILTFDQLLQTTPELAQQFEQAKKLVLDYNQNVSKANEALVKSIEAAAKSLNTIAEIDLKKLKLDTEFGTTQAVRDATGRPFSLSDFTTNFNKELDLLLRSATQSTRVSRDPISIAAEISELNRQRESAPISEQATLDSSITQLSKALDQLTNRSELLKKAQEDLADRAKVLFQNPRDIVEEFLTDPNKARQAIRDTASLERARRFGIENVSQRDRVGAFRATELLIRLDPEAGQNIKDEIFSGIGEVLRRFSGSDFGLSATPDQQRKTLAQTPEGKSLEQLTAEVKLALEAQATLESERKGIFDRDISDRNEYLQQLRDVFQSELASRIALNQALEAGKQSRQQIAQDDPLSIIKEVLSRAIQGAGTAPIKADTRTFYGALIDAINLSAVPDIGPFNLPQGVLDRAPTIDISKELDNFNLLKQIDPVKLTRSLLLATNRLRTFEQDFRDGGTQVPERLIKLREAMDKAIEQIQNSGLNAPSPPIPIPDPRARPANTRPPANTGSGIQRPVSPASLSSQVAQDFREEYSKFSSQFFIDLNSVFTNITSPIAQFAKSTGTLISSLERFNEAGGIRVANIPQEVKVSVVFDENLIVEAERSNSNEKLLAQIGLEVSQQVQNKLNELRFGRVPTATG